MPLALALLPAKARTKAVSKDTFALRTPEEVAVATEETVHVIHDHVICDTEPRGHPEPENRSPLEIVLDATEGFIPLWAKRTTLRWRFRESTLQVFADPMAARQAIEGLMGAAILKWGDASPVKFSQRDDAWDFEIVVREGDQCNMNGGCVLASAFFPDAGRHQLVIFPKMFTQSHKEQVDTLIHEIGHIFGLRHFFAQISETNWPSEVFGKHRKFSIMNYGKDSELTNDDRSDLKRLYKLAWSGELTAINGTPIRFVKPFHASGTTAEQVVRVETLPAALHHPAAMETVGA